MNRRFLLTALAGIACGGAAFAAYAALPPAGPKPPKVCTDYCKTLTNPAQRNACILTCTTGVNSNCENIPGSCADCCAFACRPSQPPMNPDIYRDACLKGCASKCPFSPTPAPIPTPTPAEPLE